MEVVIYKDLGLFTIDDDNGIAEHVGVVDAASILVVEDETQQVQAKYYGVKYSFMPVEIEEDKRRLYVMKRFYDSDWIRHLKDGTLPQEKFEFQAKYDRDLKILRSYLRGEIASSALQPRVIIILESLSDPLKQILISQDS